MIRMMILHFIFEHLVKLWLHNVGFWRFRQNSWLSSLFSSLILIAEFSVKEYLSASFWKRWYSMLLLQFFAKTMQNFLFYVWFCSGGFGNNDAMAGANGTVTGKECPPGLFGVFCKVQFLTSWACLDRFEAMLCLTCYHLKLTHVAVTWVALLQLLGGKNYT